jgi:hypothetical protein
MYLITQMEEFVKTEKFVILNSGEKIHKKEKNS